MSKIASVRNALQDGGIPELARRTQGWLGRRAAARRATPAQVRPAQSVRPPVATASDVEHAKAYAWFETRRATYERLAAAVAPYVDRTGVVFDVGGNIGYFTKVLGETVDFRGTVHLFEPVPNLASLCAVTLADAPYDVHVHNFGLGETDAEMDIYIGADGNLGWNTVVAEKAHAGMQKTRITIRALRDLGLGVVPDFVKIDVEGAESQVIRGMLEPLRSWASRPVILCEVGWGKNHPQWEEEVATFAELEAIGYRVTDLDGVPLDITELEKTTDVLFLPA